MIEAFIRGAERAEEAGFHGVELHGAHGYLLCQFLSAETNRRDDCFGGSLENRMAPLQRIIDGIRARCGAAFQLGVRLSPERFGMTLDDATEIARRLLGRGRSITSTYPFGIFGRRRSMLQKRPSLHRSWRFLGGTWPWAWRGRLTAVRTLRFALERGADFVLAWARCHSSPRFPEAPRMDGDFQAATLPVSRAHLVTEGLGPKFVDYMATWKGFVSEDG